MTTALAVSTTTAALLSLLVGLQVATRDRERWPNLRWLDQYRMPLAALAVLSVVLSGVLSAVETSRQKLQRETDLATGPHGEVNPTASKGASENELAAMASERAREALKFLQSGDDLLRSQEYQASAAAYRQSVERLPTKAALVNLAIVLRYVGDVNGSISSAKQAVKLRATTADDQLHDANAILQHGIGLCSLGRTDDALSSLSDAFNRFRTLRDRTGQAAAEYHLGLHNYRNGKTDDALKLFLAADQRFAIARRVKGQANAQNAIGVIYLDQGQMDAGIKYLRSAVALFRSFGDKLGEAGALMNVATADQDRCELDAALTGYTHSVNAALQADNRSLAALAKSNIASVHLEKRDPAAARRMAREALLLCKDITAPEPEGWSHLHLARAAAMTQNWQTARDEVTLARSLLERTNEIGAISAVTIESQIHAAGNRLDAAASRLDEAWRRAKAANVPAAQIEILLTKSEVAKRQRSNGAALASLREADEICTRNRLTSCDCRDMASRISSFTTQ